MTELHQPSHRTVRRRDRGATFIELLVAIVLLGTIVVATLAGLRASIIGSTIDENSARAQAWLQAAADEVHTTTYLDCDANNAAAIQAGYQAAASAATRPNEWGPSSGATVAVTSVLYLSGSGVTETWGDHATCATGDPSTPLYTQLITLVVTDPEGEFTAELEVIKSV